MTSPDASKRIAFYEHLEMQISCDEIVAFFDIKPNI